MIHNIRDYSEIITAGGGGVVGFSLSVSKISAPLSRLHMEGGRDNDTGVIFDNQNHVLDAYTMDGKREMIHKKNLTILSMYHYGITVHAYIWKVTMNAQ